jgi:glutamate racemase
MIWIFDSWLWWLSVRKELAKLMPDQNFCYIADSAYCPYGRKKPEQLQDRCRKLTNFLIGQWNCDLVVVACNTATAAAIEVLRSEYSIPFVWMEPAIKPAILHSKTWTVWVLATDWTFKWALYHRTLTQFQWDVKVIEQIWDWLVELVEQNKTESEEAKELLTKYLTPMIDANVDHIVLWCTHYPFLIPMIEKILNEKWVWNKISIINPAPAVALQTQRILKGIKTNNKWLKNENKFYSTWNVEILENFVNNIIKDFQKITKNIISTYTINYSYINI